MLQARTRGQSVVEYVVIVAMIVIAIIILFIPAIVALLLAAVSHSLNVGIVAFVVLYAIIAFLFLARRRQLKKTFQVTSVVISAAAASKPQDSSKV